MKKLLLLFCLSFISGNVFSQNYVPFPDSSAQWNVKFGWYGSPNWGVDETAIFFIDGDTLISGNIYSKIFLYHGGPAIDTSNSYYVGAIREQNKKIFFRIIPNPWTSPPAMEYYPTNCNSQSDTADFLLYDFNLIVGDTIRNGFTVFVINSIDSVLVQSTYRKRFNISNNNIMWTNLYEEWIEGIGSTRGILDATCPENPWGHRALVCYQSNSISYITQYAYQRFGGNCYSNTTGLNELFSSDIFTLSPNPFHNFITIKNNQQKDLSITIFSSIGEVVQRATLIKEGVATINLSGLAAGIYLVAARSDKNFVARKIVKE